MTHQHQARPSQEWAPDVMYRDIVLGVDGSEQSTMAAYWCAAVATHTGAKVPVVHGLSHWIDSSFASMWPDVAKLRSEVELRMRDEWCKVLEDAGVDLEYRIVADDPATALVAAIRELDADLVVVGRHGRRAWAPRLLGSVTHKLLHDPPCPAVVVPGPLAQPDRAAVDRRIVVGVDGSQRSVTALAWAAGYARTFDLPVQVVWAVFTQMYHEAAWLAKIDDDAAVAEAQANLRPILAASADEAAPVTTHNVIVGHPGETLVEQSRDAKLLVVGTRGHGAIGEFLIGSVSHYCATRSHCPVVLVPVANHTLKVP